MQTSVNNTSAANLFAQSSVSMPRPVCVTAFIAPQSLIGLSIYTDDNPDTTTVPQIISVGTYMSNRSILHICNFTNAANALKYAFMLKGESCPISKNAFALLQAEIKRTAAVNSAAQKSAADSTSDLPSQEQKEKVDKEKVEAEILKLPKPKKSTSVAASSILEQYREMKKKHPDSILLFRVGDFYETFADDAVAASDILKITLTRSANGKEGGIELVGFPHNALDIYLPKLVRAGRRVAICEQLESPKKAKAKKSK